MTDKMDIWREPKAELKPQAWERERYEPMRWFARFERYRRLGPGVRSVRRAWEQSRAEGEGEVRGGSLSSWFRSARRWRWRERAEAWDQHRLDQASQTEDPLQLLRNYGLKAAQTLIDLLDSKSDLQRRKAAVAILDRIGAVYQPGESEEEIVPITLVEVVRSKPRSLPDAGGLLDAPSQEPSNRSFSS